MTIYFADGSNQATAAIGQIHQVVSGTKTSDASYSTSTSFVDIGLSVTITPMASVHKVLILWNIGKIATSDWSGATRLMRGSTAISIGDGGGYRPRITSSFARAHDNNHWGSTSGVWLDSPSAGGQATTYKLQVRGHSNSTVYVNRGHGDASTNDVYTGHSASSIIAMEVD